MPITFELAPAAVANDNASNTLAGSIDVGTPGADAVLLVFAIYEMNTSSRQITGMTYGGQAMSFIAKQGPSVSTDMFSQTIEAWYLLTPPSGANTLDITLTGSGGFTAVAVAQPIVYSGVSGIGAVAAKNGQDNSAADIQTDVTTTAADAVIVSGVDLRDDATDASVVALTNNVERAQKDYPNRNGASVWVGERAEATIGTYTVGAHKTASFGSQWEIVAVELLAASGAGAHDLVVAAATATGAADTVALTQVHDLVPGEAAASGAADAVAITQVHALAAEDATAAGAADATALTQEHALTVADAVAEAGADLVTLPTAGEHDLVLAEAAAAAGADAVAITQEHPLALADAAAAADADAVAASQVHALVAGDTAAGSAADTVAITQQHDLVVMAPHIEPEVDVVALLQIHALSVEDAIAAGAADSVAWFAQALGEIRSPGVAVVTARRSVASLTPHRTVERLH